MKLRSLLIIVITAVLSAACSVGSSNLDTPPPADSVSSEVNEILPSEALPKVRAAYSQFVDVRSPAEYASGHAVRAINIPQEKLSEDLGRLEKNEPVYLICETGRRSAESAELLKESGFKWVFTVSGGTSAWREAGLPMESSGPQR